MELNVYQISYMKRVVRDEDEPPAPWQREQTEVVGAPSQGEAVAALTGKVFDPESEQIEVTSVVNGPHGVFIPDGAPAPAVTQELTVIRNAVREAFETGDNAGAIQVIAGELGEPVPEPKAAAPTPETPVAS